MISWSWPWPWPGDAMGTEPRALVRFTVHPLAPDGTAGAVIVDPDMNPVKFRTQQRMSERRTGLGILPGATPSASLNYSDMLTHCERPH
jgi:hypothetical protein